MSIYNISTKVEADNYIARWFVINKQTISGVSDELNLEPSYQFIFSNSGLFFTNLGLFNIRYFDGASHCSQPSKDIRIDGLEIL